MNIVMCSFLFTNFSNVYTYALAFAQLLVQLGPKGINRKVEGACLAGRLPWLSDEQAPVIQQIRANNDFFRRPWYDCVQVQRLGVRGQVEQAYAELRLLFEADVSTPGV